MKNIIITQIIFTVVVYIAFSLTLLTFDLWSLYCSITASERAFVLVYYVLLSILCHIVCSIVKSIIEDYFS